MKSKRDMDLVIELVKNGYKGSVGIVGKEGS